MFGGIPSVPVQTRQEKMEKIKEFSELVREQYAFLVG
jgi:hypothetical protein